MRQFQVNGVFMRGIGYGQDLLFCPYWPDAVGLYDYEKALPGLPILRIVADSRDRIPDRIGLGSAFDNADEIPPGEWGWAIIEVLGEEE